MSKVYSLKPGLNIFNMLVRKAHIPQIIKDKLPSSLKLRIRKLFASFDAASRSKIFESMEYDKMDEDLLRTFIRYYAHALDKISRTRWNENKACYYDQYRNKIIKAIRIWRGKNYVMSDDILWAEQVIKYYSRWYEEKKPVEPAFAFKGKRECRDLYEIIRQRRSIRYFENKDVSKETIMKILEAGRWAPCSGNRQAWKYIVQKRVRGQYSAKLELDFEKERKRQGSIVIYVAVDERLYPEKYAAAMDVAASIQNMLLMLHHLDLGGCWLYLSETVTNQNKLRKKLGLEDYYYIYSCILIGYPAEFPGEPCKKPLEKLVSFVGFDSEDSDNLVDSNG